MKEIFIIFWESGEISLAAAYNEAGAIAQHKVEHPEDAAKDVRDIKDVRDLALYQWRGILNPDLMR